MQKQKRQVQKERLDMHRVKDKNKENDRCE